MTVDEARDHLYALTPGEFTAERNALARAARDHGDRDLAAAITALRKPTVAAWLVNALARAHPDEIAALRELGAALREATGAMAPDQLRALAPRQQQILHALAVQARALATAAGIRVSQDAERGVEQTLRAAIADDDAGAQVAAGALADTLAYTAFPTTSGPANPAAPDPRPPAAASTTDAAVPAAKDRREQQRDARIAKARDALAAADAEERRARERVEQADHDARRAADAAAAAQDVVARAATELATARARLEDAQAAVVGAQDEEHRTRAAADTARAEARRAAERRQAAADRLLRFEGSAGG